ncbi:putative ABC transporter permease [Peptostreptococcus faecalis]|uniref:putative ABC transporter permease n=1 Tax=Peptostreptococcus faecalis TaxID=2045015 RepID=UPI000C7A5E2D|nr:putative ABC transporter permease [Peptostreptococcus faecalis]
MEILFQREIAVYIMYFFIYAFLGWVLEVAYHALKNKSFVNRGMLAGAVCPIYGFGAVALIYLLEPIRNNTFILFLGATILCTLLELIVGIVLDKLFSKKWWDYSDQNFNFKGYICLEFSLYWGVGGIILVNNIQSVIYELVSLVNTEVLIFLDIVLIILIIIDLLATVQSIKTLNVRLDILSDIQKVIHEKSDSIGENVSEKTIEIAKRTEPVIEELANKREEVKAEISGFKNNREIFIEEGLAKRIDKLTNRISKKLREIEFKTIDLKGKYSIEELSKLEEELQKNFMPSERRLLKAFPTLKEKKQKKEFEELKKNYENQKNKGK